MKTIRESFHDLGNWHNKIGLAAITTKEILESIKQEGSLTKAQESSLTKSLNYLSKIESYVEGADHLVELIKPSIYSKFNLEYKSG